MDFSFKPNQPIKYSFICPFPNHIFRNIVWKTIQSTSPLFTPAIAAVWSNNRPINPWFALTEYNGNKTDWSQVYSSHFIGKIITTVHLKTYSRLHVVILHGLFAWSMKCEYMLKREKRRKRGEYKKNYPNSSHCDRLR